MITQALILILSGLSVWLVNAPGKRAQKWAPVFGLAGQPIWLWATYTAAQWGMFLVSIVFTVAWLRGLRRQWRATEALDGYADEVW